MNSKLEWGKKIAEYLIIALAILFVGKFVWQGWDDLVIHIEYAKWYFLLIGIFLFFIYFILRALSWRKVMESFGADLPAGKASYIWFISEFSRYIPGNIWSFAGRVYLSNKEKVPKRVTSLSLILEIFYLVGSSIALSLLFFLTGPGDVIKLPQWLLIFFIPIIIVILSPKILEKIVNRGLKMIKKDEISLKINLWQSLGLFSLYLFAWLAYGLGSYFSAIAFVDLSQASIIWLTCAFVLSWIIGYLSFITPMGLGVREAALVTILKAVVSGPLASLIAIVTRLNIIVSELAILGVISIAKKLDLKKIKLYCKENKPLVILWSMMSLYFVYFMTYSSLKHANYLTSRYDLGNMDQVVWNTANGNFFQLTNPEVGGQVSRFFIHGDIFLALVSPLYHVVSSPYVLLFLQTAIIALGALPLYKLATSIIKNNSLSLVVAFSYLMYPATQWANIFDFHAVTLATSLLLFTFYYAYKNNALLFVLFALISLTTKETIAFSVILMCIYMIFTKRNRLIAAGVAAVAAGWFFLLLWRLMPEARAGLDSHFGLVYYSSIGKSPNEIFTNFMLHPWQVVEHITTNNRWIYLPLILAPNGFLAVASPYAVLAAPGIAVNILSDQEQMRTIYYQYTSDITPFLYISSVFGLSFLLRLFRKYKQDSFLSKEIFYYRYIIITTLVCSFVWSPLPFAKNRATEAFAYRNSAKRYLDNLSNTIPKSAKVSATNRMSPHFSQRQYNYLFPNGVGEADYLILEEGYKYELTNNKEEPSAYISRIIRKVESDERYIRIYKNGNIQVFRKR